MYFWGGVILYTDFLSLTVRCATIPRKGNFHVLPKLPKVNAACHLAPELVACSHPKVDVCIQTPDRSQLVFQILHYQSN
jgi:hypothetical protein